MWGYVTALTITHNSRECKRATKKKLPNLVWNVMKERELKALCKKYGVQATGKKPQLIKRLQEYTLRFNAQIDQTTQKTGSSNI